MKELNHSIHSLDEKLFQRMIEEGVTTIKEGHKIIVSGLGKNVPICDKFVGSMVSLGLPAYFLHTNSAIHGDIGLVKDKDMVIILTKSGETAESIYLVEKLQERNVVLWLLTFNSDSTLTRKIPNSLVLKLEHEGDLWNIMPNNSTTLYLIILQQIAMQLIKRMDITLEMFKPNHPGGAIGAKLVNS